MSKGRQFTVGDRELVTSDVSFWERSLSGALEIYKHTSTDSEDHLEAKSVAMAALAGLGLSMYLHFSDGVSATNNENNIACTSSAQKIVDSCVKHHAKMEELAEGKLN
jgi:hypothetical protein